PGPPLAAAEPSPGVPPPRQWTSPQGPSQRLLGVVRACSRSSPAASFCNLASSASRGPSAILSSASRRHHVLPSATNFATASTISPTASAIPKTIVRKLAAIISCADSYSLAASAERSGSPAVPQGPPPLYAPPCPNNL